MTPRKDGDYQSAAERRHSHIGGLMTDRALLQVALHALEKHALTKEEKLIALIREQLKKPERQKTVYVLDTVKRKMYA